MDRNVSGQNFMFSGYGGIEDTAKYMEAKYGSGWVEAQSASISGVTSFKQSVLEKGANNCTLAAITRVMKYYSDMGYDKIPSDIKEIYQKVREVGISHNYSPKKTGLLRDLFIYTPWGIDNIVQDSWKAFGYSNGNGDNIYFFKLRTIKRNIQNLNPVILNISFGDYTGHSASIIGYKVFSKTGCKDITLLKIYDGWSETVRYIDWKELGMTPTSVTRFFPPAKQ